MDETEDDLKMCEDNFCKIIWFHFKCVCIKKYLKGNGFVQNEEKKNNTKRKCLKHFCGLTFQDQILQSDQYA